jgi:hypothetical protein
MARFPQAVAVKGSQMWVQKLVNEIPNFLDGLIREKLNLSVDEPIEWRSPLKCDGYAEYRDQDFVDRLSVELNEVPLADFWPRRGPQWDALGRSSGGKLFLVEAKSHISELESSSKAKNPKSEGMICESLRKAKAFFGSSSRNDWSQGYYQYANRLAHLYLLKVNLLPAYLVFVYFLNDSAMNGPRTEGEWKKALDQMYSYLGLKESRLREFVVDLFIDVSRLKARTD